MHASLLMVGLFPQIAIAIGLLYYSKLHDTELTRSALPPPPEDEPFLWIERALLQSALVFQALLNAQSRTFAGRYKISAGVLLLKGLCSVLVSLAVVVGSSGREKGFTIEDVVIEIPLLIVSFWQAIMYPAIAQAMDVDEEE